MIGSLLEVVAWVALVYLVLVAGSQVIIIGSAALSLRSYHLTAAVDRRQWVLSSPLAPRITVLAPAHNEEASVVESVRSLLALSYPRLEVALVNDGSGDGTMAVLRHAFGLVPVPLVHRNALRSARIRGLYRSRDYPELLVIDKDNGGKADALNAALNCASGDLVCVIDADTIIETDALLRMVGPFLNRDDIVAAGGTVGVVNGCEVNHGRVVSVAAPRRFLVGSQAIEYMRAFLFGRLGWNRLGGNLIISGAFGLFRRQAIIDIGGYNTGTVGEDMELVVALRRHARRTGGPDRVEFVPDPVAWTEVPSTLGGLRRQRDRWHRGLADVLHRHAGMIGNPREGALGLMVAPYFLIVELLAPVAEAFGIIAVLVGLMMGAVDVSFAVLFFTAAYGFGVLINLAVLILEQAGFDRYRRRSDKARLVLWAFTEGILFRPLTLGWRLLGLWRHLRGHQDWGAVRRQGFTGVPSPVQERSTI